jgi:hypothetical protein
MTILPAGLGRVREARGVSVSKKFRGELCVYCAERTSDAPDHVFAKKFFLPIDRDDLPQVPACKRCNGEKSHLEEYLMAVLPFGGRHESAKANLETMVPRRLEENRKLLRQLAEGTGAAWSEEGEGLLVPAMTLPIEPARLESFFALVARGLVWHHWRTYLTKAHSVAAYQLAAAGDQLFDRFLSANAMGTVVGADLGHGACVYEGAQGVDCPQVSIWRFSAFGGVKLGGDPTALDATSSRVGVLTGPSRLFRTPVPDGLPREARAESSDG